MEFSFSYSVYCKYSVLSTADCLFIVIGQLVNWLISYVYKLCLHEILSSMLSVLCSSIIIYNSKDFSVYIKLHVDCQLLIANFFINQYHSSTLSRSSFLCRLRFTETPRFIQCEFIGLIPVLKNSYPTLNLNNS